MPLHAAQEYVDARTTYGAKWWIKTVDFGDIPAGSGAVGIDIWGDADGFPELGRIPQAFMHIQDVFEGGGVTACTAELGTGGESDRLVVAQNAGAGDDAGVLYGWAEAERGGGWSETGDGWLVVIDPDMVKLTLTPTGADAENCTAGRATVGVCVAPMPYDLGGDSWTQVENGVAQ